MVVVTQIWTCVQIHKTVHQKEKISHEKALKLIVIWPYHNMLNYSPLTNAICFQSLTCILCCNKEASKCTLMWSKSEQEKEMGGMGL